MSSTLYISQGSLQHSKVGSNDTSWLFLILLVVAILFLFSKVGQDFAIISLTEKVAFGNTWRVAWGSIRSDCPEGSATWASNSISIGVGGGSCDGKMGVNAITDLGADATTVLATVSGSVNANRDGSAGMSIGEYGVSAAGSGFGDSVIISGISGTLTFVKQTDGTWTVFKDGVLIRDGISRLNSGQFGAGINDFEITLNAGTRSPQGSSGGQLSITHFRVISRVACTPLAWSCSEFAPAPSTCPPSGVQSRTCTLIDSTCSNPDVVKPNLTMSCTLPVTFCPSVCIPLWNVQSGSCALNQCGSGCGADNITTFSSESLCKATLPAANLTDFVGIPIFPSDTDKATNAALIIAGVFAFIVFLKLLGR